jgi:uncharacterized OB-fold protein
MNEPAPAGGLFPPLPEVNETNQFYWNAARDHRLELLRCQSCGHFVHFPRPMCDRCQSSDLAPEGISGRGSLYSYCTVVRPGHPYFIDKVPYILGIVDINEETGVRIPAGIVEHESSALRCGTPVEVVFRALTPDVTLPFFRPRRDPGGE